MFTFLRFDCLVEEFTDALGIIETGKMRSFSESLSGFLFELDVLCSSTSVCTLLLVLPDLLLFTEEEAVELLRSLRKIPPADDGPEEFAFFVSTTVVPAVVVLDPCEST